MVNDNSRSERSSIFEICRLTPFFFILFSTLNVHLCQMIIKKKEKEKEHTNSTSSSHLYSLSKCEISSFESN